MDDYAAAGGFAICPNAAERGILRWMIEAYLGEPGRSGTFGRNRAVFFSDIAAPRIERILAVAPPNIKDSITHIANEPGIKKLILITEQQQRLDHLLNLTSSAT
jgi:hypothetical protein